MATLSIRLLVCCAAAYAAWRLSGPGGLVFSALVFGLVLARPIVDGMANAFGLMRLLAYRDVEGRYHSYKGKAIDVLRDDEGYQWLRISDVRGVVSDLPKDETLRALFGPGVASLDASGLRVKAEVLHDYLAKSSASGSLRFRLWVQRTIMFPAGRMRARSAQP